MCSDIIPIASYKKAEEKAKADLLPPQPPKNWWDKINPLK
jgi:hypothetical protein